MDCACGQHVLATSAIMYGAVGTIETDSLIAAGKASYALEIIKGDDSNAQEQFSSAQDAEIRDLLSTASKCHC